MDNKAEAILRGLEHDETLFWKERRIKLGGENTTKKEEDRWRQRTKEVSWEEKGCKERGGASSRYSISKPD